MYLARVSKSIGPEAVEANGGLMTYLRNMFFFAFDL